jgi:hypothetical protein
MLNCSKLRLIDVVKTSIRKFIDRKLDESSHVELIKTLHDEIVNFTDKGEYSEFNQEEEKLINSLVPETLTSLAGVIEETKLSKKGNNLWENLQELSLRLPNERIVRNSFINYIQDKQKIIISGELIPTSSFTKDKEDVENNFSPSIYESLQLTSEGVEEYKDIDIKDLDNVFSDTFFSKDNDIYTNLRNIFKGDLFGTLIFDSADTAIPFKDISNVDTVTDIVNSFKNQLVPTDSK